MKILLVNADDYGLCESVNEGVLECLDYGLVSDLSFMINLDEFEVSQRKLKQLNRNHIGFHLNLTVGRSIIGKISKFTDNSGNYLTLKNILLKIGKGKITTTDIYQEIKEQILFLLIHGYKITHIDSHRNIHLHPKIMKNLIRLNNELCDSVPIRMPYENLGNAVHLKLNNFIRISLLNLLTIHCRMRTKYHNNIKTIGGNLFNNSNIINAANEIKRSLKKSNHNCHEIPIHPGYPSSQLSKYDSYCEQRLWDLQFAKRNHLFEEMQDLKIVSFKEIKWKSCYKNILT